MSPSHQATFITPEGTVTVEVSEDEYLLDALNATAYSSPFMCLQGWCLTCAAELVEGEVDMGMARRYYEADREAEYILLCSAKPRSDLVVRTEAKSNMVDHRLVRGLPAPRG